MLTVRSVRPAVWFATGVVASLVATLLVMNAWRVDAAPGDADATFVPVTPCRLFDFRTPPDNVGPKSSPLGPGETYIQQVTGDNGNCVGIPADAVAVAMNVTIVNPTAQSNLRLFPADVVTPPLVSNLNWKAGQSPTPNKVDVKLSPDGKVKLVNLNGSVDVIGDVVGYYTNSTLVEIATRLQALEAASPVIARSAREGNVGGLGSSTAAKVGVSVTIEVPVAGVLQINGGALIDEPVTAGEYRCSLSLGAGNTSNSGALEDTNRTQDLLNDVESFCHTSGAIAVDAGTHVVNLVLQEPGDNGYDDATIDVIFIPGDAPVASSLIKASVGDDD